MKLRRFLSLTLILGNCLCGCSTVKSHSSAISPVAERIVTRLANYYQNLNSFEGTNTITDQSPTYKMTRTKQFAFVRPNRFLIRSTSTNDSQLICDGMNLYDYQPYYFNSYTKAPAPDHYEDAMTNWVGGELVRLMVSTNRFRYVTNGFGWGLVALKDEGRETVTGVVCHHLFMRERGSRTAELWIAAGGSPFIVKYVFRWLATAPQKGVWTHTETISGWKANVSIPPNRFVFVPPAGAIEHAVNANTVETSVTITNGVRKDQVKFEGGNEPDKMKKYLEQNGGRLQAVALKSILAKYAALTANDLAFLNIQPSFPEADEKMFVVTFALPKTKETTNGEHFLETKLQTISVTLTPDGAVKSVSRGYTISHRSLNETEHRQSEVKQP